jgi:NAD(P)-dependent dehydrogenase (short-subunit alcohol dehydrogenase family)
MLNGKIILITGATSGLGWRFAKIMAEQGGSIIVTGRRTERLDALCDEIKSEGGQAAGYRLDVTDYEQIKDIIDRAEREVGPIDVLVNNSGMNREGFALEVTPEDFDATINTNLKGAFFMATEVGRRMVERECGSIINIASVGANRVLPGLSVYCMSKAGIAQMTRVLAREWARPKVNVNAICPGYIETELNSEWFHSEGGEKQIKSWPRRRLMEEESLDGMVLFLASDQGRFTTGSVLTVDDGQYI